MLEIREKKTGEPPTAGQRQRGMSYIMPGPKRFRKKSTGNGSVYPATDAAAEGSADDTATSVRRRGSRRTISQPPSRPLERKLSIKDNINTVARDAFGIIDINNDGYLQKEEVIDAIKMMRAQGAMEFDMDPVEMAESMMVEVDIDGDGQIDIDEFVEMMRKSTQLQLSKSSSAFSYNHRMSQLARNVLLAHQKKIENAVVGNDLWLIHPLSNMHAAWDVLVSILILLTVLTMPLSLGWEEFNEEFFVMNLVVDLIFLLDVCKNFCTGFVDENDAVIMDARTVRWNYLKGFFVSDFSSSIPLDLILKAVSDAAKKDF
uniref:EF-hand domain-containing protein n=1 Tax=Odontella aurita TaxID=265563 RepID=A0A7S4J0T9_9STRA|mmetsp:Transcript_35022/g.104436  ORF Transcript_35022/g.104436 Transcript_35022/m.104436 type:complete len:317 (+) Transcript_35022:682-1632(+)